MKAALRNGDYGRVSTQDLEVMRRRMADGVYGKVAAEDWALMQSAMSDQNRLSSAGYGSVPQNQYGAAPPERDHQYGAGPPELNYASPAKPPQTSKPQYATSSYAAPPNAAYDVAPVAPLREGYGRVPGAVAVDNRRSATKQYDAVKK